MEMASDLLDVLVGLFDDVAVGETAAQRARGLMRMRQPLRPGMPRPGLPRPGLPQQPGIVGYPYPQQPGIVGYPYPQQPGIVGYPYPQQPGYPGGYGYPQQPGYPGGYGQPTGYDDYYTESDTGGYYSSEQFPGEGTEGYGVGVVAAGDFEYGGMGADNVDQILVGSWGSFWKGFKGIFKTVFKGVAKSGMVKTALNAYSPGSGDAAQKGLDLIAGGKAGNKTSIAQIKSIADAAKAGDKSKQGAHDMLKTINEAHNEVKAEVAAVAVGKAYKTITSRGPDGKSHTTSFGTKASYDRWCQLQKKRGQPQRPTPTRPTPVRPGMPQRPMPQQPADPYGYGQPQQPMDPYGYPQQPTYSDPYGEPYGYQDAYGYETYPGEGQEGY
jgi:hypothetical protein